MLYDYLENKYGKDVPILFDEIQFEGYSKVWLSKELSKLCRQNKIVRYEKGLYYIPIKSILGGDKPLNIDAIIERKYIRDNNDIYGFYAGWKLLNKEHLTTQNIAMPIIYTNNETTRNHLIKIGNRNIILKKPKVEVNKENVSILKFFDIVDNIPEWMLEEEYIIKIIREIIVKYEITQKIIRDYSSYYPDKTVRKFIDKGIIYEITQ